MRGRGRVVPFGAGYSPRDGMYTEGPSVSGSSKGDLDVLGTLERVHQFVKQDDERKQSSSPVAAGGVGVSDESGRRPVVPSEPPSVQSSSSSSATKLFSQLDTAPGQSTITALSLTPPPSTSSVGPSASATGSIPVYPTPQQNYFGPPTWMHPYPPQYPYAMPFVPGYFSYPYPPQHSQTLHPSESSGSTSSMQTPWMGPTNSYKVCVYVYLN